MKHILFSLSIFALCLWSSCETQTSDEEIKCAICNSYCCDQIGTENCCCAGIED